MKLQELLELAGKIIPISAIMPLFFQQDIDEDTRLAVWKIEEEESFFNVPLQREIVHPKKRLQHLAGRFLLRHVFPEFPLELIEIADTRKPFLKEEAFHFSISHCGEHAAVIVSKTKRVGVDIELMSEKIDRIRHKFLSDKDHPFFANGDLYAITLAWSCKEAVFKWWGFGGVDFRENIRLKQFTSESEAIKVSIQFTLGDIDQLSATALRFSDLSLSWVVN
jgi:phosphopantetheinyl transferase